MKKTRERKPYEKPAVILDKDLEVLAADCGDYAGNTYLGGNNCKGEGQCAILYS